MGGLLHQKNHPAANSYGHSLTSNVHHGRCAIVRTCRLGGTTVQDKLKTPDNSNQSLHEYLTLSEAAKTLPRMNGRRVHTSTLWRWARKGYNGIRLEYAKIGRTIVVSDVALNHFFTSLAAADYEQTIQPSFKRPRYKCRPRSEKRQAEIDAADAVLRRAKILA